MFHFSLEPVLDVKKRYEESAQRELAHAKDALAAIEQNLDLLYLQLRNSAQARLFELERAYDAARLQLYADYARDLGERIDAMETKRVEAQAIVDEKRKFLLEKAREKQVMEELKKTEAEEYRLHEQADERKRYDDIAIFSYSQHGTA